MKRYVSAIIRHVDDLDLPTLKKTIGPRANYKLTWNFTQIQTTKGQRYVIVGTNADENSFFTNQPILAWVNLTKRGQEDPRFETLLEEGGFAFDEAELDGEKVIRLLFPVE